MKKTKFYDTGHITGDYKAAKNHKAVGFYRIKPHFVKKSLLKK